MKQIHLKTEDYGPMARPAKNRHINRQKGRQVIQNLDRNAEMNGMKYIKGRQDKLIHR